MKHRWLLLALIAVVAIILMIALLGGPNEEKSDKSDSYSVDAEELKEENESVPNIDPNTGMELEEDELPIMTP